MVKERQEPQDVTGSNCLKDKQVKWL